MSSNDSYEDDDLTLDDFIVVDEVLSTPSPTEPTPLEHQESEEPSPIVSENESLPETIQEPEVTEVPKELQEIEVSLVEEKELVSDNKEEQSVLQNIPETVEVSEPINESSEETNNLVEEPSVSQEETNESVQETSVPQEELKQETKETVEETDSLPESDSYVLEDFITADAITTEPFPLHANAGKDSSEATESVKEEVPVVEEQKSIEEIKVEVPIVSEEQKVHLPQNASAFKVDEPQEPVVEEQKIIEEIKVEELIVEEIKVEEPVIEEIKVVESLLNSLQAMYQNKKENQADKVWNIEQSILELPKNSVICLTQPHFIHALSALLNRPDITVHICLSQLDSRIQQLVQEFPERVHLSSLPYEQVDTGKQRFQLISLGNCETDHMLLSHFQKAWRASGSRCIWIVEDANYPNVQKALGEILTRKDFVNELSFDLRAADQWISQVEK